MENSRERLSPAHVRCGSQGKFSAPGNGKKKKKKGLGKISILVLEEVIDPKMEKVWIYGMQGG